MLFEKYLRFILFFDMHTLSLFIIYINMYYIIYNY